MYKDTIFLKLSLFLVLEPEALYDLVNKLLIAEMAFKELSSYTRAR